MRDATALAVVAALGLSLAAAAGDTPERPHVAPDSVSTADGLAAWSRIYEVASHPRCANCHVGASDRPMWSGPSYGKTRVHGMNVVAGVSRIGAETVLCSTCHVDSTGTGRGNPEPHAAPRVTAAWRLAPPEAAWFGQSSQAICAQLKDKARNGNRTPEQIADHLGHDVILHWAWSPGGGREPAPYDLTAHTRDILLWGAAGQPCPE
jgi:hypothetical protein